jgi:hypothetical protein
MKKPPSQQVRRRFRMVVAKGGIEPPTRGFSILHKQHLHPLIVVDTIPIKSIRINRLENFLP